MGLGGVTGVMRSERAKLRDAAFYGELRAFIYESDCDVKFMIVYCLLGEFGIESIDWYCGGVLQRNYVISQFNFHRSKCLILRFSYYSGVECPLLELHDVAFIKTMQFE